MRKVHYDLTSYKSAKHSLMDLLHISEIEIMEYVYMNKDQMDAKSFIREVKKHKSMLIEIEVHLVSLHVTTSKDHCAPIKKLGLHNLHQVLELNTPLKQFLHRHQIQVDVDGGTIQHRANTHKLNRYWDGFTNIEDKHEEDVLHSRLYEEYMSCGYLHHCQLLKSEDNLHQRPGIIQSLADYLQAPELVTAYKQDQEIQCYVIKYNSPIYNYSFETFEINKQQLRELLCNYTPMEIRTQILTWLIGKTLDVIHHHLHYPNMTLPSHPSYLKYETMVFPKQIQQILTLDEYLQYIQPN